MTEDRLARRGHTCRTRGPVYCPLLVWRVIPPQAGAERAHSMGGLVRAGLEGMKVAMVPMAKAPTRTHHVRMFCHVTGGPSFQTAPG